MELMNFRALYDAACEIDMQGETLTLQGSNHRLVGVKPAGSSDNPALQVIDLQVPAYMRKSQLVDNAEFAQGMTIAPGYLKLINQGKK